MAAGGLDAWDAICMVTKACGGTVTGRVAMQKLVYFVTHRVQTDGITYAAHLFGPYSRDVALRLGDLIDSRFLDCRSLWKGRYRTFQYSVSPEYKNMFDELASGSPAHYREVGAVADAARKECELDQKKLAYAAKMRYACGKGVLGEDDSAIRSRCEEHGWDIPEGEVGPGKKLLGALGVAAQR